jgi:hypothetical protein
MAPEAVRAVPRGASLSWRSGCSRLFVQRRFPKGLKVHVHSLDRFGCLAALTSVLQQASIDRPELRHLGPSACSLPARAPAAAAQRNFGRVRSML